MIETLIASGSCQMSSVDGILILSGVPSKTAARGTISAKSWGTPDRLHSVFLRTDPGETGINLCEGTCHFHVLYRMPDMQDPADSKPATRGISTEVANPSLQCDEAQPVCHGCMKSQGFCYGVRVGQACSVVQYR